jgi:hypothetical protein
MSAMRKGELLVNPACGYLGLNGVDICSMITEQLHDLE